jgi:small subunit ribosomal protein S18
VAAKAKRRKDSDPARPATRTRSGPAVFKRKSCQLCKHHLRDVDYKDVALLRRYLSERGKIRSRRMSGACRRHQRLVAVAVKRAREMALLPYVGPNDSPPERQRSTRKR